MEHITTTRSSAGSESRPLGGRKLTNHHATAEWCARQFKPKPDFDRFEAVQILEETGTAMPARRTAELLGVTPAQVNRNENRLMALQLITFRDSPNHKRCGTRCPESGRITSASGIDLSPLGVRLHYLRQMRDAILETRRRRSEYSLLITRLRRRIRGIFSGIAEGSRTAPAGVEGLVDEFEALLESFCSRLDSDGAKAAETLENDQNMRPRHHDDATLGSHRCDAYTIQPSSMNQDTGSASPEADRPCGDMYGLEGGGSGRGGASSSPASRSVSVGRPTWGGAPDRYLIDHIDLLVSNGCDGVLDVACGDGRNSSVLVDFAPTMVGIDLSLSGLRTFRDRFAENGWPQPILLQGDFLATNLIPAQFDLVICINSVPHFEDPELCIQKIGRMLRPGGRAFFNAFTPNDVAFGQGHQLGPNLFQYRDTLFKFHTLEEIAGLLPPDFSTIKSEVVSWDEPDHGDYRKGSHTHEASYFIVEKRFETIMLRGEEVRIGAE